MTLDWETSGQDVRTIYRIEARQCGLEKEKARGTGRGDLVHGSESLTALDIPEKLAKSYVSKKGEPFDDSHLSVQALYDLAYPNSPA